MEPRVCQDRGPKLVLRATLGRDPSPFLMARRVVMFRRYGELEREDWRRWNYDGNDVILKNLSRWVGRYKGAVMAS